MRPKNDVVSDVNHIHNVLWVIFFQELEDLEFNTRLVYVFLLVLYQFQGDFYTSFVVNAFKSRTERAFSKELYNFVSVADMVTYLIFVVTSVIIVTVVQLNRFGAIYFGGSW